MKEIRLGVIGTWGRGRLAVAAHMPKKNVRIVAGADIYEDSLKKFQERIGFKINTYTDYKKMLDREDLDAVFVTSPDFCHEEHAIAALKKKIPVYLEKPMAITIKGCDRILKTAYENKTKLFLGHNMRYMKFIHKMKELIDSGAIGEVKAIWCRHFIAYGGDAYFRDWHSERKYSTSLLLQKGAHDIDVMHWLAGSYTKRVTGLGGLGVYDKCGRRKKGGPYNVKFDTTHWPPLKQTDFSPKIDVEDLNMILMELQNGVKASYMQCHYTPDSCRNYTIIGTEGRIENYGDHGPKCMIQLWNKRTEFFRLYGDKTFKITNPLEGHGGADEKIIEGFIDYIRNDKKPFSSPVASRYSVAAGFMGAKSIRAGGKPFDVPPLDKKIEHAMR
ncbi:MAG TPA: Gfo/Idh/MocA family oxidoreductase [Victivallales bacterium]|nr:Gfo/Idh/MocA family oxidoreductase [Victivallales bacterium]